MKKVIIDTCFFVSLLLEADSEHENAVFLMEEMDKQQQTIIVFPRIIEETITVFTYKKKQEAIASFMHFLKHKPNLEIWENNHAAELEFFFTLDTSISFIDASILYHAKQKEIAIVSFDKQLIQIFKRL